MKRFLSKILVFAVVVYVLALGLDVLICNGLLHMDNYRITAPCLKEGWTMIS